jgi:hypothetical protein
LMLICQVEILPFGQNDKAYHLHLDGVLELALQIGLLERGQPPPKWR